MSRPFRRLAVATVAALCWAVPAHGQEAGQDPYDRVIGRPIVRVELQIEGRPDTTPAFLNLIDIHPGDRLSIEAWRRVTERFDQVPRFEGVSVKVVEQPDGVVLIFDLVPRHPIDALDFEGETGLPIAELERQVGEQFNGLPPASRRADVEDQVRRILKDEGYRSAVVTTEVIPYHDPDRATLKVNVNAGPRTIVADAVIRGQSSLDPARTLARLGVTPGAPYRERALVAALAEIRDELRARQFYTAIAQHQTPTMSADGTKASLVITIDAGPLVVLQVVGALPGSVDDFIPIKRQSSVDADLLDDSCVAIREALQRQGYWRATATHASATPTPDRLVITFTIDRGKRYRVVRLDVPAGLQMTAADFQAQKALATGAWFDQNGVVSALLAIKSQYQERGFHRVVMNPTYDEVNGRDALEGGVVIHPNITEGPKAIVTRITFDLGDHPIVPEVKLRPLMLSREQAPYVPGNLVLDREVLPAFYESRGFLSRTVSITPQVNATGTEVQLAVVAREGPQVKVGEIIVVGNEKISAETILREITLRVGEPYSESARIESQRRLYNNLSSFRSVRITADERLPGETTARIVISVEESSAMTFDIGGGIEGGARFRASTGLDRVEFAPRAFVAVGRRNLGGRNRAVNLFARAAYRPNNAFTEYRVTGSYRERYAFRSPTDILLTVTSEQAIRTSFNFIRRVGSAEVVRPVTPRVTVLGRYSLEWTKLFDEVISVQDQPLIDRLFPQVRLSMFSGGALWDGRDNPLNPTRGGQVSGNVDVALRSLGSEVGFVKSFGQASVFRAIPSLSNATFAGRVQVGLARGFERPVAVVDGSGQPVIGPDGTPLSQVVADLPASQRFFAGGSNSVRGFQVDRLGVPAVLDANGLSAGGNGLVVFNAEIRVKAARIYKRDLRVVAFVDAGNVFHRASDVNLAQLRTAVGFGVRYDSPLGPLRLDFGFKTDRLVFATGPERRWEFHLSIGEVF